MKIKRGTTILKPVESPSDLRLDRFLHSYEVRNPQGDTIARFSNLRLAAVSVIDELPSFGYYIVGPRGRFTREDCKDILNHKPSEVPYL